mmetsp:Transcript_130574/g.279178  ORF Transcript_130574/g.279178 Transcript_130574/m.279178 type:complete len:220 (+) Transcript_130574:909-1568(+)
MLRRGRPLTFWRLRRGRPLFGGCVVIDGLMAFWRLRRGRPPSCQTLLIPRILLVLSMPEQILLQELDAEPGLLRGRAVHPCLGAAESLGRDKVSVTAPRHARGKPSADNLLLLRLLQLPIPRRVGHCRTAPEEVVGSADRSVRMVPPRVPKKMRPQGSHEASHGGGASSQEPCGKKPRSQRTPSTGPQRLQDELWAKWPVAVPPAQCSSGRCRRRLARC